MSLAAWVASTAGQIGYMVPTSTWDGGPTTAGMELDDSTLAV
jgi:hypothetical protein